MSAAATATARRGRRPGAPVSQAVRRGAGTGLGVGLATLYMSLIVFIPLGAVVWRSNATDPADFWRAVTTPEAFAALTLTIGASLLVVAINVVMGTLIAWILVRDDFPGKRVVDTLVDMPFALPTIVAGLVLLTLYGPNSPVHIDLAYRQAGVVVALLFVTLPFVVRTVQPVLIEMDREMEEAAASLGADPFTVFRRILLPNLLPAIGAGAALSFARAISEFGSTVLISGNLPFKTEVTSVHIFGQIESDNIQGAAAESTVLLLVAVVVLVGLDLGQRWAARRG
jgi:sulfate transport system permease protein